MNVSIRLIDETLPIPEYQTKGAVAFDVYSRMEMQIEPHKIGLIPTNLVIKIPEGYMLMIASRSSMPKKKGLLIPHGMGIIDQDYHGKDDEILMQVLNFTDEPVKIERGERVGQGIFVSILKANLFADLEVLEESRGGFGSTGQK